MRPVPFAAAALCLSLAAPAMPAEKPLPIAWGPVTDGLRAGLLLGSGRTRWALGEDVPLELHLRNRTRSPLKLHYFKPSLVGWAPNVVDARGKPASVETPPLDYPVQSVELTLRPGESVRFGQSTLALRSVKEAPGEGVLVSTLRAQPGRYRVTQPYRFHSEADGFWTGEIATGAVTLDLRAPSNQRTARRN